MWGQNYNDQVIIFQVHPTKNYWQTNNFLSFLTFIGVESCMKYEIIAVFAIIMSYTNWFTVVHII